MTLNNVIKRLKTASQSLKTQHIFSLRPQIRLAISSVIHRHMNKHTFSDFNTQNSKIQHFNELIRLLCGLDSHLAFINHINLTLTYFLARDGLHLSFSGILNLASKISNILFLSAFFHSCLSLLSYTNHLPFLLLMVLLLSLVQILQFFLS